MSIFGKIFGDSSEKYLKQVGVLVEKINLIEKDFQALPDGKLRGKTEEFKNRLNNKETLKDILPEAFALVREGAKRTLSQRHFDVQLLGGIALHDGKVVEMKTGEGKTLVATLPLYLNALEGKGCHLVTVNDYLSRRDTVWMGQIYNLLGLSVGCLNNEQSFLYDPDYHKSEEDKDEIRDEIGSFKVVEDFLRPVSKKEAYAADITYGTNNEFGFDYLRDNMVTRPKDKAQRGFNYTIVDEVDSILIDEARTPLIISAPSGEATDKYYDFDRIVADLIKEKHYIVDEKMRVATFTEEGQHKIVEKIKRDPWAEGDIITTHQLSSALQAKNLYLKDRDYIVKDGSVIIVDEFTGRLLPGRRFSEGLHQAIEAKENVKVQQESRTLATVTFQNFFRMYKKLSGMTGTAATSAEEFNKVYGLDTVLIPTNLTMARKDFPDKIYRSEKAKFNAIVEEIKKLNDKGQPVLVGTTSIEKNEYLGKLLEVQGVTHNILNAKNHEKEAEFIAQAGKYKAVTIATNLAGRGVDIVLGGNPQDKEEAKKVKNVGGLYVLGTERHEARRVDNQLRGRSGRQGDPGCSQFFISLEDDIVRIFGGDKLKNLLDRFNFPEDLPIQNKLISNSIESAQAKVEGNNFDIRKHLLEYDDVLNKQRKKTYSERDRILILSKKDQEKYVWGMISAQINKIVDFHTNSQSKKEDTIQEIINESQGIVFLQESQMDELKNFKDYTKIKDYILNIAKSYFEKKKEEFGENFTDMARAIQLQALDVLWMEHLENMEALRDSVRLRAYGQIDPLVAYKIEGSKMFQGIFEAFEQTIASTILKISFKEEQVPSNQQEKETYNNKEENLNDNRTEQNNHQKAGRNDPCPCGSGKKYKKCCYPKFG
jgi:preprotein translocase subunit SecA